MFKDFNADKCINTILIFCFQTFCGCCFNWFQSKAQFVDFSFSHFYSNLINGNSNNSIIELKKVDHRNEVIHENCLWNNHVFFVPPQEEGSHGNVPALLGD